MLQGDRRIPYQPIMSMNQTDIRIFRILEKSLPKGDRFYMVLYCFEGRNAHQTLGMLLTRRLDRAGLRPTGFVATDYSIAVWGLADLGAAFARNEPSLDSLFVDDMYFLSEL